MHLSTRASPRACFALRGARLPAAIGRVTGSVEGLEVADQRAGVPERGKNHWQKFPLELTPVHWRSDMMNGSAQSELLAHGATHWPTSLIT